MYAWCSALDGSWSLGSLFLDGASLRKRVDILVSGDTTRVAEYSATAVTVRTRGGPKGATTKARVVATGTYSSAAIEALAAAMPFSAGASRTISTVYGPPSRLGIVKVTIRVVGTEPVNGRAAWRVAADTPGGGTVFWIDAVSHAVLHFDTREGDALITFRRAGVISAVGPDGCRGVAVGRPCAILHYGSAKVPFRHLGKPPQRNVTLARRRAVPQSSISEVATCAPNLTP